MANHVSALKRVRITERRTEVNRMRKSRLRSAIKGFRKTLESKDAKAASDSLSAIFSIVDRSAKWGIIKKNAAARYKSRLTARVKAIAA